MATATKKTTAKKVTKKTAAKKTTKKATASSSNGLTTNQYKVLGSLKNTTPSQKELSKPQISKATGIKKGFSRIIGAVTKEGFGAIGSAGLEPLGLVKSSKGLIEGSKILTYAITAKGKKALEKHNK